MCDALPARTVVSILAERSGTMARVTNRLAALMLALTATTAATACSVGGNADDDKAGSGGPVEMRLASTNGDLDFTPAVQYFVRRVEQLSGGDLRIEAVDEWGDFAPDAEQQVVRGVAGGDVDLGWAGTRVFDTLGVKSFQALTAPMLVDSYSLENAVIEHGITEQMMNELDELDVVGLAVLPDGLRKPVGVTAPILGPSDWQGIAFGTLKSNGQAEAIRALQATPAPVFGTERDEAIKNGRIQGFEVSIWIHHNNLELVHSAPYVTSNVTLWPQMDVLLANPARLAALTAQQREWLEEAARDAATRSAALADTDARALRDACATGARYAEASSAEVAALEAAFAPVYAKLRQHPETRTFIERIQALKESTPPEPQLAIPAECTGKAPEQAAGDTGTAPAHLNGTYRFVLTKEAARKAGERDLSAYPHVNTYVMEDGNFEATGGFSGTYSVEGNRITFAPVSDFDYTITYMFTVDDEGNLDLDPLPSVDPGDAFEAGSHTVWTKID
jgi:TRAP-type C4-dicarboxylate transport system substrate-binding protein